MAEQPAAQTTPRPGQGQQRGGRRDDRRNQAPQEPKEYEELVINIDRVARVVKGGRRFRFKALVVVGNKKGKVGVGVSKGQDVQTAVAKATDVAKKHLITVPILNGTIPHDVEVKFSGAQVLIKPAAPGTGIIAGGVVRQIIGVTGINNMLSKSLGSTNKVNIAYAVIEALQSLVPRDQWLNASQATKKAAKKAAEAAEEKPAEAPAEEKTVEKKAPAAKKADKEETK
jgi:small subunit ribosomal protein S5